MILQLFLMLVFVHSVYLKCSEEYEIDGMAVYWVAEADDDPKFYFSNPICINKGFITFRECNLKTNEFIDPPPECEAWQSNYKVCYPSTSEVLSDFCFVFPDSAQAFDQRECPYNQLYIRDDQSVYEYLSNLRPIWLPWRRNDVNGGVGDFIYTPYRKYVDPLISVVELAPLVTSTEDVQDHKCLSMYNGQYSADCTTPRYHVCLYDVIMFNSIDFPSPIYEPDFCREKHENEFCRTSWDVGLDGITCICPSVCQTPAVIPERVANCGVPVEINDDDVLIWTATQQPVKNTMWTGSQVLRKPNHKFITWSDGWILSEEPGKCQMCETHWKFEEPILTLSYDTELKVHIQNPERAYLRQESKGEIQCYSHLNMETVRNRLSEVKNPPYVGVWQCSVHDIANTSNIIRSNKVTVFGSKVYFIVEITCNTVLDECTTDLESTNDGDGDSFLFSPITRLNLIITNGVISFDQTYQAEIEKGDEDYYQILKARMKSAGVEHLNPRTYHLEYCEEFMVVQKGHELHFAQVSVNQVSRTTCYDEQGYAIKVTCIEDHSHGARFSAVPDCHTFESNHTTELGDLETSEGPPEEIFTSLIEILQDKEYPFQSGDLNKTINILENIGELVPKEDLMESINILMDIDPAVFHQAQTQLNVSDRILDMLDEALTSVYLEESEVILEHENLMSVLMSEESEYRGVGISSTNETILLKDQTIEDFINMGEWQVMAYLNYSSKADLFESDIDTNSTNNSTSNIRSITLFHSTTLFNEKHNSALDGYHVYNQVFSILVPEYYYLQSDVEILLIFPTTPSGYEKTECAFWYYGQLIKGSWKTDSSSTWSSFSTDKYKICTFNHTTHFGQLLMMQNDVLSPLSERILSMMTMIVGSISSLGIVIIFITAICFPSWGITQLRTLNFCLMLLMQTMLLFVSTNYGDISTTSIGCTVLGACLHFVVLSQFCWMVALAHRQYQMFVKVYNPRMIHIKWIMVLTSGLPAAIVTITLGVNKNTYGEDNLESMSLCYPSGYTLISSVLAPACFAMVINIIIYFRIIYELHCKRQSKEKTSTQNNDSIFLLKLRLFGQLFFTLGISWWLGLLAFIFKCTFLLFGFSITTAMQGFVLFLYVIVADKKVRKMYIRKLNSACKRQ